MKLRPPTVHRLISCTFPWPCLVGCYPSHFKNIPAYLHYIMFVNFSSVIPCLFPSIFPIYIFPVWKAIFGVYPLLRSVGQFSCLSCKPPPSLVVASQPNYKTLLLLSKVVHLPLSSKDNNSKKMTSHGFEYRRLFRGGSQISFFFDQD